METSIARLALLSSLFVACTASSEPSAAATSPLVECSGTYACALPSGSALLKLTSVEGRLCFLHRMQLDEGGLLRAEGTGEELGTWSFDASSITVCPTDEPCYVCTRKAATPTAGAKCTGSPSSCDSESPGSCSSIRGCRMATRVRYNGTYDNYCDGTPDDCDEMSTQSSCVQQGCTWK